MPRKAKVQRTPQEKFQIVLEGLKGGNIAENLPQVRDRSHAVLPLERRSRARGSGGAWGRSAAARPDEEQNKRIKQLERALGRSQLADRNTKKRSGRVSCGQLHSQARQFVAEGQRPALIAATTGHQPVELVLPPTDTRFAGGSPMGRADHRGLRRKAGLRLPPCAVVDETRACAETEPQARTAGDARTRPAGALSPPAGNAQKGMEAR